jgi:hypothetical protein
MNAHALEKFQPMAVLGMERFDFDAVSLKIEAAVGEYAVNIQR